MFESEVAELVVMRERTAVIFASIGARGAGTGFEDLGPILEESQALATSVEAVQFAAMAHLAARSEQPSSTGLRIRQHPLGYVDDHAPSTAAISMRISTTAAGRRVHLGARLASAFPGIMRDMATGAVTTGSAAKVVSVCEDLDLEACAEVEAALLPRLPGLDPARVTSQTRRIVQRVAAEQVVRAAKKNRAARDVDVSRGPDGTTIWWAQLPADRSAAMWAAITELAASYRQDDPALTQGQARADALADLVLHNVTLTTQVTLGIPVLTSTASHLGDAIVGNEESDDSVAWIPECFRGLREITDAARSAWSAGAPATIGGIECFVSGVDLPKIGYIPPDAVAGLISVTPVEIWRAVIDAETGVLRETTSAAYRTPAAMRRFVEARDGHCRMYGCSRPATGTDTDHGTPWPRGSTTPTNLAGLCRRHHRTKQQKLWRYAMDPDGVCTWTSPTGRQRVTYPLDYIEPHTEPTNMGRHWPASVTTMGTSTPVGTAHSIDPVRIADPPPF